MTGRIGLGQRHAISANALDNGVRGIFERHYFANNGPLVQELDAQMARICGAPFGCAIANEFLAVALAARVIFEPGVILIPAHLPEHTVEALRWAGVDVAFADVEVDTLALSPTSLEAAFSPAVTGIFSTYTFGSMAGALEVERFAREHRVPFVVDASDAVANSVAGREIGTIGDASIVSMHQDRIVNAGEGAVVLCATEHTWNGMRTIRNFHAGQTFQSLPVRMNGKMAEGPAMLALASLAQLDTTLAVNARLSSWYRAALREMKGARMFEPAGDAPHSGRIALICESDQVRENVANALSEKGVPHALVMRHAVELPNRSAMTEADVRTVCDILRRAGGIA